MSDAKAHHEDGLHIFVNRRKFEEGDGVRHEMTGAQIAALVGAPADNAVVRLDSGPDKREIGINEVVKIKSGEHFLVTRKIVEGGHESGEN
jgi:Multiubiquitin